MPASTHALSETSRLLRLGLRHRRHRLAAAVRLWCHLTFSVIFSRPVGETAVGDISPLLHGRRACGVDPGTSSYLCLPTPSPFVLHFHPPVPGPRLLCVEPPPSPHSPRGSPSEAGEGEKRRSVCLASFSGLPTIIGMDWEAVEMVCSVEFWRMAILWTLSLLYSYLLLVPKGASFFLPCRRRLQSYSRSSLNASTGPRPICVVTGATSGLGAAAAKALAVKGYYVVLVGRSPQLLSKIVEEIMEQVKDAQLKEFIVDLSSIHSIMEFKSSLEQWLSDCNLHPSLQLLINNAGILARTYRVTTDGYDQMMGTNFMSAFALTNLLLPLLENSPLPSRIVNVTSFTHRCVSSVQINKEILVKNLCSASAPKRYPFAQTYECSKFYLLLFTYALHRKLHMVNSSRKVSIIAADPGVVETRILRELPECLAGLAFTVLRHLYLLQTPEDGVSSVIDAALAPPEASGLYYFGGKGRTIKSSALSYDEKLAEVLWSRSFKLFQKAQTKLGAHEDFVPW